MKHLEKTLLFVVARPPQSSYVYRYQPPEPAHDCLINPRQRDQLAEVAEQQQEHGYCELNEEEEQWRCVPNVEHCLVDESEGGKSERFSTAAASTHTL